MHKVAIFVEGLTEQIFFKKLLSEIFGKKHLQCHIKRARGNGKGSVSYTEIEAENNENTKWHFLIVECGSDTTVKSFILEHRESLARDGFEKVIGVRDVFPIKREELEKLRSRLYFQTPQKPFNIAFVLCIMEIETWFVSEFTHFLKISDTLTPSFIQTSIGFNPETDNIEDRQNPASDLNAIYALVGKSYVKKEKKLNETMELLNYEKLYFELPSNVSSLNEMISHLNELF